MRALSALGLLFAACQLWPRVAHADSRLDSVEDAPAKILIDLRRRWDDGDPTLLLRHLNLMTRNGTLTDEWEAIRQELASLSPVKLSKAFREQHPFDSLESWRDAMARIDFESGSRCGTQEIPAPLELLVDEAVRASIEAGTFQFNVDDTGTGTDAKREWDTGFNRSSTLTYIRDMIRAGTPHKRREGQRRAPSRRTTYQTTCAARSRSNCSKTRSRPRTATRTSAAQSSNGSAKRRRRP